VALWSVVIALRRDYVCQNLAIDFMSPSVIHMNRQVTLTPDILHDAITQIWRRLWLLQPYKEVVGRAAEQILSITFMAEKDMRSLLAAGITRWTHMIPTCIVPINQGITSKRLKETRDVMQHIVDIWPVDGFKCFRWEERKRFLGLRGGKEFLCQNPVSVKPKVISCVRDT